MGIYGNPFFSAHPKPDPNSHAKIFKIITGSGITAQIVGNNLDLFAKKYPLIIPFHVAMDYPNESDLHLGDVIFRSVPAQDSSYITFHLLTFENSLYAAPEYIKNFGIPKEIEELAYHKFISFSTFTEQPLKRINWYLYSNDYNEEQIRPLVWSNNNYCILAMAERGSAIISYPKGLLPKNTNLIPIMPGVKAPPFNIYMLYHEKNQECLRIEALKLFSRS